MNSILSFSPPIVKRLLGWKKGEDDDRWCEKAVKSLVKKLKKSNALEEIEKAISTQNSNTKCVTIPSFDLCAEQRKGLPHVIYCRLWRWPDLQSHHELKALDTCQYAFNLKREEVCVNPYHYQKIERTGNAHSSNLRSPILVPRHSLTCKNLSNLGTSGVQSNDVTLSVPENISVSSTVFQMEFPRRNLTNSPERSRSPLDWPEGDVIPTGIVHTLPGHPPEVHAFPTDASQVYSTPFHTAPFHPSPVDASQVRTFPIDASQVYSAPSQAAPFHSAPIDAGQLHTFPAPATPFRTFPFHTPPMEVTPDEDAPVRPAMLQVFMNQAAPGESIFVYYMGSEQQYICRKVEFVQPLFWCSISYYEYSKRVGETFHGSGETITVDGFTDPQMAGKFSVGVLQNITRDPSVEKVRDHIREGVSFCWEKDAVYLLNKGERDVFVQSYLLNQELNREPTSPVRVTPQQKLRIFSSAAFANIVASTVPMGYRAVFALSKICILRISFVKGWGVGYTRPFLTSVPCWIELHLNGPLQWLDKVLTLMDPPAEGGTSWS